jgi:glycosyltransferase involved in cell wall biosynthesis
MPPNVYLIYNEKRAHKLVPLLDRFDVCRIASGADLITAVQARFRTAASSSSRPIVLVDSFGRFAVLALLAAWCLNATLAVRIRGNVLRESRDADPRTLSWAQRLRRAASERLIRLTLDVADCIIYNSKHVREQMRATVNPQALDELVYNPYTGPAPSTAAAFPAASPFPESAGPEGLNLLTVTNMDFREKAFPTLHAIEHWVPAPAWERLNLRWVVLGNGKYMRRFQTRVSDLAWADRVRVEGWVDNPRPYYGWANLLVHLTRLDNFPNVVMEAMMHQCPVITNENSCGTREQVVDGETGAVVSSADEFVEYLRRYQASAALRRLHGERGRNTVEDNWTVAHQRRRMERVLQKLAR